MPRPPTKFVSPFEPLNLGDADKAELKRLADDLVLEHIHEYQSYRSNNGKNLPAERWRHVRQEDRTNLYVLRRDKSSKRYGGASAGTKFNDLDHTRNLVDMRVVGTVSGNLDDCMYGSISPTLDAQRIMSSYLDDNFVDGVILATLEVPTPEEPYRSLNIKYRENAYEGPIKLLAKNQDFIYLESTGVARLETGEEFGYKLAHSVHFPQTHSLDWTVRGNVAVCFLMQQNGGNDTDIYSRVVLVTPNEYMRHFVIQAYGKTNINIASQQAHTGQMKKLAWLMRRRNQQGPPPCGNALKCHVCSVKLDSRARACRLCSRTLCTACQMVKILNVITPDERLHRPKCVFCASCVDRASKMSAFTVAVEEIMSEMSTNSDHRLSLSDCSSLTSSSDCAQRWIVP